MARFQILPTETRFFDLFDQHAQTLQRAATQLRELLEHFDDSEGKMAQLTETEHHGDYITHELIDLARRSFMTPFDTQDIAALAGRLDDGIDGIEAAGDATLLWKIERPTPESIQLAKIIERGAAELAAAVPLLRDKKRFEEVRTHIVEVNRLENEADRIARAALSRVLAHHDDVFDLLRWKELYDLLEAVTDRLEDVADAIEGLLVKHG